jgi:glycosyltransferase involved in cell wall biosynthesis
VTRSVLLAASFPPALGGVETLLYQTNRRLREPPLVVAPAPAAAPDLTVVRVETGLAARAAYRPLWRLHPSLHYLQTFWRPAVQAIRHNPPGLLQAGHVYLAPLTQLLARRFRLRWLAYAYGQEVWRGGRPMGLARLDARLRGGALRGAEVVFSPGSFTSGLLLEWGVDRQKIAVVPYGAEPRPASAAPAGRSLLTVARLVPRKGIDMVIRALRELPGDVEYRVVGHGPDEARLRRLAMELGVASRVGFLGRLDDAALAAEYQRCGLFVLPARRTAEGDLEGYGLVHFEAAAWGRPVVAGRSGGEIDAVVDGETGRLVDGGSLQELTAVLAELIDDADQRARLGRAGRERVERSHNWTCAAHVVDRVLEASRCR